MIHIITAIIVVLKSCVLAEYYENVAPIKQIVLINPYIENSQIRTNQLGISLPIIIPINTYYVFNFNTAPLLLTPYIESSRIEEGRLLSSVVSLPNAPYVPSYSGFFTVNKKYNSNLFFWFFPALNHDVNAPIILWLQGGPGASGLIGLFVEHGPYVTFSNATAGLREHTWAKEFNVIYVDSPVGTGFSYTDDKKGYATNEDQVAEDLYSFLVQFFKLYYEYTRNDLYVCGESYGGKHVPYLGHKIHLAGSPADTNFKGICIGNGFYSLDTQYGYSDYLYKHGIIDLKQARIVKGFYESATRYQQNGEKFLAIKEYNKIGGYFKDSDVATRGYLREVTGFEDFYNLLVTKQPDDFAYFIKYLQSSGTRNAIHVGSLNFHTGETVQHYLKYDILTSSSKDKIAFLINNDYKVLLYSGQLDLVLPHIFTASLLSNLTWKYSEEYKTTIRGIWKLSDDVTGYVKCVGNFHEALIRNAGHLAPHDQPETSLDLITQFVKGTLV